MLRVLLVVAVFFTMTPVLVAIQWLLSRLSLPGWSPLMVAYYRLLRRLLRLRVEVAGAGLPRGPVLVVANHVSWVDIVLLSSMAPVAFVAKREVADWPLIGRAAKAQGSIFVDRARRQQTSQAGAEIAQRLSATVPVVLFAEGTSSDGNRVLPFRTALVGGVGSALADAAPGQAIFLQPLSICYPRQQGLPMGRQFRPLVAWYGDMNFMPHFLEFIRRGAVDAVLTFGDPVPYERTADRKALVRQLEDTVRRDTAAVLRG